MTYQRKQNLLVKIYNHYVRSLENISHLKADLDKIEIKLIESGIRRNRYAHADFTIISKKKYVKVKTKSGKDGVRHIFVKFDQEHMESDLKFVRDTFEELENFNDKFIDSMTDTDWEKYDEMLRNISPDIQS
ncbi:MAG: hypothetical protein KI791_01810 [Cyclobacteriaceae bacterium]|nr:hypothetical protein [Cyclobacteriaceae bacterium SS2]